MRALAGGFSIFNMNNTSGLFFTINTISNSRIEADFFKIQMAVEKEEGKFLVLFYGTFIPLTDGLLTLGEQYQVDSGIHQ